MRRSAAPCVGLAASVTKHQCLAACASPVALPSWGTLSCGDPRAPRLLWRSSRMWDDLRLEQCLCSEVWWLEGLAIILMSGWAMELSQRVWPCAALPQNNDTS